MTEPSHAVFLSYASQDAEAAQRICEALRAVGIEVWFDQSELRGGDVWDRKIRQQIHDCALFVPIISANTQARAEGYFRLEWRLADQRTHLMGRNRAFLVPVCTDATSEQHADVPDSFLASHWTRMPGGRAPPEFVAHIQRLLSPATRAPAFAVSGTAPATRKPPPALWRSRFTPLVIVAVLVAASLAYWAVDKFWVLRNAPLSQPSVSASSATTTPFTPPPHSIAVLPFTNLSGDPNEEYFSDGISEELINALARIQSLQVIARTSSFSFKGQKADIATIARRLNVAAILEGSVHREGSTVRITAQLINAVNGFHIWSEAYDRDLASILKLQTDIATTVARQLQVKILSDAALPTDARHAPRPEAYEAYLRGLQAEALKTRSSWRRSVSEFTQAVTLDPSYAQAYAALARAQALAQIFGGIAGETMPQARAAVLRALELDDSLAEAHATLAFIAVHYDYDWAAAGREFQRALQLNRGDAWTHFFYSNSYLSVQGRHADAIAEMQVAIKLDPLSLPVQSFLGRTLVWARKYREAVMHLKTVEQMNPSFAMVHERLAHAYTYTGAYPLAIEAETRARMLSGEDDRTATAKREALQAALRERGPRGYWEVVLEQSQSKTNLPEAYSTHFGLAIVYARLGDAERAFGQLAESYRSRELTLTEVAIEPAFDSIRADRRFGDVLQQVGLSQVR